MTALIWPAVVGIAGLALWLVGLTAWFRVGEWREKRATRARWAAAVARSREGSNEWLYAMQMLYFYVGDAEAARVRDAIRACVLPGSVVA